MRFLCLLHKIEEEIEVSKDRADNNVYTIYDKTLYEKYSLMSYLYKTDNILKNNYFKIIPISHPFEQITTTVKSSFIKSNKPLKITNAFMKIYEIMKFLEDNRYIELNKKELSLYDIAGAPGMFVISIENYLKKYNCNLDWYSSSLIGGSALTDVYGLYKDNPSRFRPCELLNENDLKEIINENKKYELVTGDVGIYHEDDYDHLQEEKQLNLEWSQMILALNLVQKHGNVILKMYSYTTKENIFLLDILSQYFEYVFISKPYTTRIFNDESYIICVNRNSKNEKDLPLYRPKISNNYQSINQKLVSAFEYSRLDIKFRMISLIERIIKYNIDYTIQDFRKNKLYAEYYNEFADLYETFVKLK